MWYIARLPWYFVKWIICYLIVHHSLLKVGPSPDRISHRRGTNTVANFLKWGKLVHRVKFSYFPKQNSRRGKRFTVLNWRKLFPVLRVAVAFFNKVQNFTFTNKLFLLLISFNIDSCWFGWFGNFLIILFYCYRANSVFFLLEIEIKPCRVKI